jgi:hypothetical protein
VINAINMGMKALPKILLALTAVAALSVTYPARATFMATIEQVGTNVVVTGNGTINFTGLMQLDGGGFIAGMIPNAGVLALASGDVKSFTGVSGPSFGSGEDTLADSSGGDAVGIFGGVFGSGTVIVPRGYVSGDPLLAQSTYSNANFASLGITPGTYIYTWGTGADADRFTLLIGGPGVPDGGSTVSLLGSALLGLAALRRKLSC